MHLDACAAGHPGPSSRGSARRQVAADGEEWRGVLGPRAFRLRASPELAVAWSACPADLGAEAELAHFLVLDVTAGGHRFKPVLCCHVRIRWLE